MFTGIVERAVPVVGRDEIPGGLRLILDLGPCAEGLQRGDSVCVAGACLTAIALEGTRAGFDLSQETLEKTRFTEIRVGDRVNVERSLRVGDRLGGHFVTGHVDGLGEVVGIEDQEDFSVHSYRAPERIRPWLVPKGSVAVEGVSLTVAELGPDGVFSVALIPETLQRTTLGGLAPGDRIHLEGDLIGKYVERILAARQGIC
ncbi:MAG: riboflavin synthase [Planctomycetota bacterium]|nr:MAG: riboflavin synthase [Planctomycetota bacterium]